jgi:hypothetical protein
MYAVIEKNRIEVSVAGFCDMAWYEKEQFLGRKESCKVGYGRLEIDVHNNGRKYLTGFVMDPREFIVDYLWTRYKKRLPTPKKVESVSVDTGERFELFCVDFLKLRSFVVDGMEKDLIFPHFCRRKGELIIQGFEVLNMFSLIRYLAGRFGYKETSFIRQGEKFFDMKTGRWGKIRLGEKKKK